VDLRSPVLQRLYRDWDAWRGARPFPSRADIDPLALRYILGNFTVTDVFYDPLRFYFRVHATASAERIGFDLTGKFLHELPDEGVRRIMHGSLLTTLEKRAPHRVFHERTVATKVTGDLEVLVLPFSSDGQVIDMLAYGTHFDMPKTLWQRAPAAPASLR
jgi:hypothetical protein